MTEEKWLRCIDPDDMLAFVSGPAWDRKRRLFACALCRRLWYWLEDARSRHAIAVAERFADGLADRAELSRAHEGARAALESLTFDVAAATSREAARATARHATLLAMEANRAVERGEQVATLRDLFGRTPFRPAVVDPSWLRWDGGTVVKLAGAIYEERAFHRLPILADALDEAGCTDPEILAHCRRPGGHARGCWVVDLILAKQ